MAEYREKSTWSDSILDSYRGMSSKPEKYFLMYNVENESLKLSATYICLFRAIIFGNYVLKITQPKLFHIEVR